MSENGARVDAVNIRKVFDNGRHNAFTSLARWQGRLYLAFRTAEGHVTASAPEGVVTLLASDDDGGSWEHVATLSGMYGMDLRDPKLVATPDRLYVHAFEYQSPDRRDAMLSWTEDGRSFVPVRRALEKENYVVWWPVYHQGRFYGAGYRYHGNKRDIRSVFYTSEDGEAWRDVSVVYDVPWANESVLIMEGDDRATVLVRNDGMRLDPPASDGCPVLARADAPYQTWRYTKLGRRLTGLGLLKVEEGYFLAARDHEQEEVRTACFFIPADVAGDEVQPRLLFTLPSGGDTSYAGFVKEGRRVLMSYYSSHEYAALQGKKRSCIYLAEFNLDEVLASLYADS